MRGDTDAWHRLVEGVAGFLHTLAWRYARGDKDLADDLVLVVLEGLRRPDASGRAFYRLRRYLESLEQFGESSRFTTWLAQVARNLFRDYFRQRQGRRILPKQIEGLDELGQLAFHCLFWDGLSEADTLEKLRALKPGLRSGRFDGIVEQVFRLLDERQLWNLYRDLMRRVPSLPLEARGQVAMADRRWSSRPDRAYARKLDQQAALVLGQNLAEAVDALPKLARQVLRLALVQNMTGGEIQRLMGFARRQRVYDVLAGARKTLRASLEARGFSEDDLRKTEGWVDGWLDEENFPDQKEDAV